MENYVKLLTEAGEELIKARRRDPAVRPWDVYPRPSLVRDSFFCLNGEWDFCVADSDPEEWRRILVPFPPQSILSGVCEDIPDGSRLWYRRTVTVPENFRADAATDMQLILHIDAADQEATVYVNGQKVGSHRGGYSRASFDLTETLMAQGLTGTGMDEGCSFELVISVYDKLADRVLPYGKQSLKRGGMWYTPVSGIWQSVWMECVPHDHIENIEYTVSDHGGTVSVTFDFTGIETGRLILDGDPDGAGPTSVTADIVDGNAHLRLPDARYWSPDDPYLYYFTVETEHDRVRSYFAVRTVDVRKISGMSRICLNGQPVFLNGLLDQGYWSDGIFTPASPDCFADEIAKLRELGFNMLRKHIKIEPDLFYYECDRSGMLVFQDMVNNGEYSFMRDTVMPTAGRLRRNDTRLNDDPAARSEFKRGLISTVIHLRRHPSIILWTIFNEGWGQFCGTEMYRLLRSLDGTRLIDTASGWFAGCETDIESRHVYFRKVKAVASDKPFLVTEFGGYTWKPQGHCYNTRSTYGYGAHKTRESLVAAVRRLYEKQILPLIPDGLCGTVYTQVSDVEDETNGIFSYDRRVQKLLPEDIRDIFDMMR